MSDTMKIGDITASVGVTVTSELLTTIGFTPEPIPGRAKIYKSSDYPAICEALGEWIKNRKDVRKVAPKPAAAPAPAADPGYDPDEL